MPLGGALYRSANLPTENQISQPEAANKQQAGKKAYSTMPEGEKSQSRQS